MEPLTVPILLIERSNPKFGFQNKIDMNMIRFSIAASAAALMLFSCSEGGEATVTPDRDVAQEGTTETAKPDKAMDPARQEAATPATPTTTMTFKEYEHDFGTMNEGDAVTHLFEFTNTGTEPLLLTNCKGSCGCTVPKCPKEPIAPGASGTIEVKFNSKGKKNAQTKRVTIDANTDPAQTILTITANVTPNPMLVK
jgi:hypothetical protein